MRPRVLTRELGLGETVGLPWDGDWGDKQVWG